MSVDKYTPWHMFAFNSYLGEWLPHIIGKGLDRYSLLAGTYVYDPVTNSWELTESDDYPYRISVPNEEVPEVYKALLLLVI